MSVLAPSYIQANIKLLSCFITILLRAYKTIHSALSLRHVGFSLLKQKPALHLLIVHWITVLH